MKKVKKNKKKLVDVIVTWCKLLFSALQNDPITA